MLGTKKVGVEAGENCEGDGVKPLTVFVFESPGVAAEGCNPEAERKVEERFHLGKAAIPCARTRSALRIRFGEDGQLNQPHTLEH